MFTIARSLPNDLIKVGITIYVVIAKEIFVNLNVNIVLQKVPITVVCLLLPEVYQTI